MQKAISVTIIAPYRIDVGFADGSHREIDLANELWGDVFAPLRDPDLFAQAAIDPDAGSVTWPTGADLSPEFLYFGESGPPADYYGRTSLSDRPSEALSEAR